MLSIRASTGPLEGASGTCMVYSPTFSLRGLSFSTGVYSSRSSRVITPPRDGEWDSEPHWQLTFTVCHLADAVSNLQQRRQHFSATKLTVQLQNIFISISAPWVLSSWSWFYFTAISEMVACVDTKWTVRHISIYYYNQLRKGHWQTCKSSVS